MRSLLLSIGFIVCMMMQPAFALLEIEISQGVESALPIAVTAISSDSSPQTRLITQVISADLHHSGLLGVVERERYPDGLINKKQVEYQQWRDNGIEALLVVSTQSISADQFRVEFFLYDLVRNKRSLAHTVNSNSQSLRRVAHKISDVVFKSLIGMRGAFSTRIAYITEMGMGKEKQYILRVADADGHNPRSVFMSNKQLMSPVWSSNGSKLAYVSFENERSEIFIQDMASGKREKVSSAPGLNSAPAWSPNDQQLALTLSQDGDPNIYILDLQSGKKRQVTSHYGIDTEPTWSADGDSIYFTSNRSGSPQIYRLSLSGGKAERISFNGRYNAAAALSPNGELLAMVHNNGQGYRIGVLNLRNDSFHVITDGGLDEAPSFAPNGSMIIFSTRRSGSTILSAVSADGRVQQQFRLQAGKVREPTWSPFR